MAVINRTGKGQVEPNHLSGMRTGQIYAQLPAEGAITEIENGQFMKYDYAGGYAEVDGTGSGEWLLVMNEIKLYEDRQFLKDFSMLATDYVNGVMVPRLYKTNIGDIFTTNMFADDIDLAVGDIVTPGASTGVLAEVTPADGAMRFQVVELTTMPDGVEPGVKLMRLPDAADAYAAVDHTHE